MVYSPYCAPLQRRNTYRWLMSLAREAIESNDTNPTVNDVLTGVVAADKAFKLSQKDEALDAASEAGKRVGSLFRPEARRVFRMHDVDQRVVSAFDETAYRDSAERLRYSREDDQVLVLYGEDVEHTRYATEFAKFLHCELDFGFRNIKPIRELTSDDNPREAVRTFTRSAKEILKRASRFGNVVVYYSGFGDIATTSEGMGGFVFCGVTIPYRIWAAPFVGHQGNVVFVNDTSFAAAAHLAFKDLGLLPDRAMVLSACGMDEDGMKNLFSKSVMRQYGDQEIYSPSKIEVHESTVTVEPSRLGSKPFKVRLPKELWTLHHKQTPKRAGADFDYLLMKYPMNGL